MPAPMTVAWISDFGLEWLPDLPEPLRALPRQHPLTWQRVLLSELEKERDLRLHIIVLRKKVPTVSFQRNGVFFHVLKVPPKVRAPSLFWVDTFLIGRALKRIRPDVLHAWGTEKGAALVASRLRYPYLVTIQGLLSWYLELISMGHYWQFARWLERLSLPRAPLVTTESRAAVEYLGKEFPHLPVWQAEHAPDWVFHQVKRNPQTKPLRFIFVGTFGYRKGGDMLISALDRSKGELDFELVIIGEPDNGFLEQTQATSSRELWKRIRIRNNLAPAQIAEELAQATMMLFPTRADTSPNAVKEAVVAGLPVVGSAVGGINDYLLHGLNGLVFPSDNLLAFADAIGQACQHPMFSRGLVDPATLAKTRAYLSPTTMAQRFGAAYQAVCSRTRQQSPPLPPIRLAKNSETLE